jgi:chromate transporter
MTDQIAPADLWARQDAEPAPIIVDVRSAAEYAAGHLPGARHIPADELPNRLDELPAGRDLLQRAAPRRRAQRAGGGVAARARPRRAGAGRRLPRLASGGPAGRGWRATRGGLMDSALTREQEAAPPPRGSILEVLAVATRLGLTSFGGPIAHLGYFREEYVVRRRWVDDHSYADLVALCQFLPGPASSQVGISLGILRAGLLGGVAAWLGFTLPSAVALVAFGLGVQALGVADAGWLHGLKVVAVAVVAQAVWGMARTLAADRERATIAILAALATLTWPTALGQVAIIVVAGLVGWRLLPPAGSPPPLHRAIPISRRLGAAALALQGLLLVGLPLLRVAWPSQALAVFDSFFRVGSLVFGGGHVVLPLLQAEVVPPGWVTNAQFVAGYGAAQAVPGPLFTFSAYLGAVMGPAPNGVAGAALALAAVFLPSFLLVIGLLPFWNVLRGVPAVQAALRGINAAVVGLLLAALYDPVWTSGILAPADFGLALVAFGLLALWRLPPWLVVVLTAVAAEALARL